jgi:hypothetical protein
MSSEESKALMVPIELACGVVAGPLFVSSFTAIGQLQLLDDRSEAPGTGLVCVCALITT